MKYLITLLLVASNAFAGVFDVPIDPVLARGVQRSANNEIVWSTKMPGSARFAAATIANTLTGYAFYAGTNTASFNRMVIPYTATQAGYLPSSALVRIRNYNSSGSLLAYGTAQLDAVINQERFFSVSLSATVPSGTPLWVEIYTNGRTQFYDVTLLGGTPVFSAASYPNTMFSLGINTSSPAALSSPVSQRLLLFWAYSDIAGTGTVKASSDLVGSLARASFSRVATVHPALDEIASVGVAAWDSIVASSSFSGHGCYIGDQAAPFNAISVLLYPFNQSHVPTRGVMRIRQLPSNVSLWATDNPAAWQIIAESPVMDLGLTYGEWREVCFPLDRSVSGHVWFEFVSNGYIGMSRTLAGSGSPTVAEPPKIHYVVGSSLAIPSAWSAHTVHQTIWCRVGTANYNGGTVVPSEDFTAKIQDAVGFSFLPTATISLPINAQNVIPALEGRELNIYWDNVIFANVSVEDLAIDVTCAKGAQLEKGWRYTPTVSDVGTTTIKVDVWTLDRETLLATTTSTLKTVALTNPVSPVSRKVLMIGDSTFADASVAAELVRMFATDSNESITLIGSNVGTGADSLGTNQAVAMEAVGGWSITRYSTDTNSAWVQINGTNRVGSPFLFAGVFDFAQYLTANSLTMSSNDWVVINHGINDFFDYTTDASLNGHITTVLGYLDTWITSIKAAVPGVRIAICLTIPPAKSQDAFGTNYTNDQSGRRFRRNMSLWREAVLSAYDGAIVSKVYVVPYHAAVDTENNYPTILRSYNARNSATYYRQINAVHPDKSGYWQLADLLRSFLKAQE